jgi:hypothetical protein
MKNEELRYGEIMICYNLSYRGGGYVVDANTLVDACKTPGVQSRHWSCCEPQPSIETAIAAAKLPWPVSFGIAALGPDDLSQPTGAQS